MLSETCEEYKMEHWIEMDSQEKTCVGISYEFEKIVKDNFLQATSGRPPLFFCISFWLNDMS